MNFWTNFFGRGNFKTATLWLNYWYSFAGPQWNRAIRVRGNTKYTIWGEKKLWGNLTLEPSLELKETRRPMRNGIREWVPSVSPPKLTLQFMEEKDERDFLFLKGNNKSKFIAFVVLAIESWRIHEKMGLRAAGVRCVVGSQCCSPEQWVSSESETWLALVIPLC